AVATRFGDAVLLSNALDAASCSAGAQGHFRESLRLSTERVALLERLPRHDPRVGGEVADIFHMASETALAAGQLRLALASSQRSKHDATAQGLPQISASHMVTPLVLLGEFDAAIEQAAIMREGWDRAGRQEAGWMAPAFYAAAMVYGLRGDDDAYPWWWDLARQVSGGLDGKGFSVFSRLRVALHRGSDPVPPPTVANPPEHGILRAFASLMRVEMAVVTHAPDADAELAGAWPLGEENQYAAAHLLRAAGRLHGDEGELEQAVDRWEAVGARFERACTLALIPARRAEGEAELAALGCPPPAVV
ncbi:MAG: hypothetical protein ACRDZ8_03910, partial [Acidimicrobiales bacterium]